MTEAQHVFAGEPDARQSSQVDHKVSRFRPTYRALTTDEKTLHDRIKDLASALESAIEQLPGGRYQSLALTELEMAVMWAVKGLTQ
jgi:N12 class adenine-specific DNA methylase